MISHKITLFELKHPVLQKRASDIAWSKKKLCLFLSSKTVEAWLAELIFWQLFDLTRKLVCAMWIICSLSSAAHNNGCFNTQCGYFMIFLSLRFYVISIFEDPRSTKCAILTHVEALNFDFHALLGLKFTKLAKFSAKKMVKTAVLQLLHSPKLISRKIWMTEKSWNFQNVQNHL